MKLVEAELNAEERDRLAEHLDAFESLDERRKLFQQAGGGAIDAAAATTFDERYQSSLETQRLEAQFELAAAALITGLTNTVTIVSGACDTNGHFEGLGFDEAHLHNIGHFQDFSSEFTWREVYTRMRQFHFRLIADLVDRLSRASDERGSSLMDDTLIVYTSDGAETHHSRGTEWPFVLIGNWGGKLRSGRFLEYPASGQAGSRVINALYCTLLHAAGAEAESFNLPREEFPDHMGPLRELLA